MTHNERALRASKKRNRPNETVMAE